MTEVLRFPPAKDAEQSREVLTDVQRILLLAPVLGRRNPDVVRSVVELMETYIADAPQAHPTRRRKSAPAVVRASHSALTRLPARAPKTVKAALPFSSES